MLPFELIRLPLKICVFDVMSFQDEEGTYLAFLGSRTFCNNLTDTEIDAAKSGEVWLRSVLAKVQPVANPHRLDPARHLCYLEAHIEQGPVLERLNLALGVVAWIAGQSRLWITFQGKAGHAGTLPMEDRQDGVPAGVRVDREIGSEDENLVPGLARDGLRRVSEAVVEGQEPVVEDERRRRQEQRSVNDHPLQGARLPDGRSLCRLCRYCAILAGVNSL